MPIGIDIIDDWSRKILLWTFDYSFISGMTIGIPMLIWLAGGFIFMIQSSYKREETLKAAIIQIVVYSVTPIIYLYVVGYIGYLITK